MFKAAISCIALMLAFGGSADASVVISTAKTQNMNCSAGVCSPTSANAVLNRRDLGIMLRASDVKVTTGAGAITIAIMSPLTWANAHRLTLDAQHSVSIRSTVTIEGTGGLTVTLEDGAAGAFNFYPGGSITFWDTASSFVVNGKTYTLVNDIATLAANINSNPGGYFALAKDYDASGDGQYEDAAVMMPLAGTFEGLGHTIANLAIETYGGYQIGMFAEIDGTVRDLTLSGSVSCDASINASDTNGLLAGDNSGLLQNISASGAIFCPSGNFVGGLVGRNLAAGQIAIVAVDVNVGGTRAKEVGGVAGTNAGMIRNASASGDISAGTAGGLVGSTTGLIQDSHATGWVSDSNSNYVGGLAAEASGRILRCYATGNVTGKQQVGGLVGFGGSLILDSSFASGAVTSVHHAGGLIGGGDYMDLSNSYALGSATGTNAQAGYAGGLMGWMGNSVSVTTSYSTGASNGGRYTGGSVGDIDGTVSMAQTYWDLDTSGVSNPASGAGNEANYPGITGLSDAQVKARLPAGFDPKVWGQNISINNGFPYLLDNPPQ